MPFKFDLSSFWFIPMNLIAAWPLNWSKDVILQVFFEPLFFLFSDFGVVNSIELYDESKRKKFFAVSANEEKIKKKITLFAVFVQIWLAHWLTACNVQGAESLIVMPGSALGPGYRCSFSYHDYDDDLFIIFEVFLD